MTLGWHYSRISCSLVDPDSEPSMATGGSRVGAEPLALVCMKAEAAYLTWTNAPTNAEAWDGLPQRPGSPEK